MNLDEAGPGHPRDDRRRHQGGDGGRQDEMPEEVGELPIARDVVHPGGGEQAQLQREDEHQHEGDPERRDGRADDRRGHERAVEAPMRARRGEQAQARAHDEGEQKARGGEDQGVGKLLAQRGQHRDVHLEGAAHVAAQGLAEPADVLHVHGLIEAERLAQLRHGLARGGRPEHGDRGVAGYDLEQEERHQGDADEHGHDSQEARGEVCSGNRRPLRAWAAPPRCDGR